MLTCHCTRAYPHMHCCAQVDREKPWCLTQSLTNGQYTTSKQQVSAERSCRGQQHHSRTTLPPQIRCVLTLAQQLLEWWRVLFGTATPPKYVQNIETLDTTHVSRAHHAARLPQLCCKSCQHRGYRQVCGNISQFAPYFKADIGATAPAIEQQQTSHIQDLTLRSSAAHYGQCPGKALRVHQRAAPIVCKLNANK